MAKTKTFTLDPAMRLSATSDTTGGVELRKTVNHYADGGDAPAWILTQTRPNASTAWADVWARNVLGPDGDLAIIQSNTGTPQIQIANLHGDFVAQIPNTTGAVTGIDTWAETTEYGLAKAGSASLGQNYGWLGTERRSTDSIGGLTLMGVRLYNPTTGRFLSRDPVAGGNDNTYTYPVDPINMFDLSGEWGWGSVKKAAKKAGKWAWKNKYQIGASVACGASVSCAVGAGVAFGVTKYAKSNGKKSFGGYARAAGTGAFKGAVSKYVKNSIGRVGKKRVGNLKPYIRPKSVPKRKGSYSKKPWKW